MGEVEGMEGNHECQEQWRRKMGHSRGWGMGNQGWQNKRQGMQDIRIGKLFAENMYVDVLD